MYFSQKLTVLVSDSLEACIQTHAASCAEYYECGVRQDSVYTINPDRLGSFQVWCDMGRGGWTVFQRRQDGSQDFYLGWSNYKAGFGDLNGEFWLGLDKIHRLSKSGQNVLRVDLMDFNGAERYAKYGTFSVADESDKYRLNVGYYSGKERPGQTLSLSDAETYQCIPVHGIQRQHESFEFQNKSIIRT